MRRRLTLQAGICLLLLAGCQNQSQTGSTTESLVPVLETTAELHTMGMDSQTPPVQINWTNDVTGSTQTINVTRVGDKIVYQGEALGNWTNGDMQAQSAIVTTRKWPNNVIPYTISATSNTRAEVLQAINYYNTKTNLRWVARTTQTDYVKFINSPGCWSYVGRIVGMQEISLSSNGCGIGGALHEMGHALGFHHEQSRPDRNLYVRVRLDLIPTSIQNNWAIESEAKAFGPYDYYSIMHYNLFYNGQKVIEVLKPGIDQSQIGNGIVLTPTDLSAVNFLYPKAVTPPPAPTGQTFKASLTSAGLANFHSSVSGFTHLAGTIKGTLTGPAAADFDLFLEKLISGKWITVADSQTVTSSEAVTYTATAGTYRWEVYSYSGTGSYTLVTR